MIEFYIVSVFKNGCANYSRNDNLRFFTFLFHFMWVTYNEIITFSYEKQTPQFCGVCFFY